jgi:membrane-bound lytic murein transglycosylase B
MKTPRMLCITIIALGFAMGILASCAHTGTGQVNGTPVPIPEQTPARPVPGPGQSDDSAYRAYLEDLLVEKGMDRVKVHTMLNDPRVVIDPKFIVKSLFNTSPGVTASKSNIMYYSPRFIPRGRLFIEENRETFDCVRAEYGISPEIITAILIIESKLGTYDEGYRAFPVYVNLALANDPRVLSELQDAHGVKYPGLYNEGLIKKAQSRGKWALKELQDLILLADKLQYDPLEFKSSNAGALGPAQFIPTTFMNFGRDGDSDGKADPFSMPDAIASTANYLKKAGWTETGPEEKRRTAIWIYNHSAIYVNTILKLYGELVLAGAPGIQAEKGF